MNLFQMSSDIRPLCFLQVYPVFAIGQPIQSCLIAVPIVLHLKDAESRVSVGPSHCHLCQDYVLLYFHQIKRHALPVETLLLIRQQPSKLAAAKSSRLLTCLSPASSSGLYVQGRVTAGCRLDHYNHVQCPFMPCRGCTDAFTWSRRIVNETQLELSASALQKWALTTAEREPCVQA